MKPIKTITLLLHCPYEPTDLELRQIFELIQKRVLIDGFGLFTISTPEIDEAFAEQERKIKLTGFK